MTANPTEASAVTALNGRAIMLTYADIRLVNVYAPSDYGERRAFYAKLAEILEPGDNLICAAGRRQYR